MKPSETYAVSPGWRLLFRDLGLAAGPLLRQAGLGEDLFSRDAPRVPPEGYHALWAALDAHVHGVPVPIAIARALSVEVFDPTLLAAVCSHDLNGAATRLARFKPLLGPMTLDVDVDDHGTTLGLRWPADLAAPPSLALTELLFWVALARITTRAEVSPTRLTAMVVPDQVQAYRDYCGIAVTSGPCWSISFSAPDARRPFLTANDGLWRAFEPDLRRRLSELDLGASMVDRARAALVELLPTGEASLEGVARKLAMSTRTVQRRLGAEGTSFHGVLSNTRQALALHYLRRTPMTAAEISFLLGYEDPNSFYRAFRAWTGSTPEVLRAAATPS